MILSGKKIFLCTPDLKIITTLNGVVTDTVNYSEHVKDYDELTFDVDEYVVIDGKKVKSNGYDDLSVYMNLYLEDIGCFQMQHPTVSSDGFKEKKSIVAYSLEKEFEGKTWIGLKINTGETDSLEQLAENNLDDLGFAKNFVEFYNPNRTDLSLMNLLLEKTNGWSVLEEDIDPLLWHIKISISESNTNLFALFTSVIAPKAECIFLFDTVHRRIKAVSKHNLNYDTNIFIGYRNLANSINITVEEDSVVTKLNCEGDNDLTISNVNYGDSFIYDFSYFMTKPYMNDELIFKLNKWIGWRNSHREEFIRLNKDRADKEDKIYELRYRVPNDGDDWNQWDEMDEGLLQKNLKYYNALLNSLRISVDDNPQYDSENNYIPWIDENGNINDKAYLDLLYAKSNGYGGYYTYIEIQKYIIPNIEIAISNLGVPDDNKNEYVKDYESNWELYGIEELTAKKKIYEEKLKVLSSFSKSWNDMTDEEKSKYPAGEEEYNTLGRSEYIKNSNLLGDEDTEGTLLFYLKNLNNEMNNLQKELETIDNKRKAMVIQANISHSSYGLTKDELIIVNSLIYTKDYQNKNILSTSVDTTITIIDREKELYDDCISKISELCEPQFTFTTDVDNLLRIKEFQEWADDFKLLRYIRLGIRDDYSVKLRITGISWNPCEITPDLTIEFSNMITSRSGRSDLTDILNSENNRGSSNSISIGTGNSNSEKEYLTSLLQLMINNSLFKNAVGNIASNTTGIIDESEVNRIIEKYAKFLTIDVEKITGDEASFKKFFGEYIDADYIVGNSATFKELDSYIARLQQAIIGTSTTETGIVFNLTSDNATVNELFVQNEIAKHISVAQLATHAATADIITLISNDGKPSIAFKNSTQQFYDSDGNVRVQIGQDGNGNFNFVIRGEDGTTALFDSTGIKRDAIPANTIINDMLEDNTISKDKIGFEIIEPNEQGGIDITQIYDGNGGLWGVQYTEFKNSTSSQLVELDKEIEKVNSTISGVSSKVDQNTKSITDKVWQTDITNSINSYDNTTTEAIRERVTKTETDISGIKSSVSDIQTEVGEKANGSTVQTLSEKVSTMEQDAESFKTTVSKTYSTKTETKEAVKDTELKIIALSTKYTQLADQFNWLVTSDSSQSSLTLTDSMLAAMVNQFIVASPDGSSSIIEGGKLSTDAIKSNNYSYTDGVFSNAGTFLDLSNGEITSTNFAITSDGVGYFKGMIDADSGSIGDWMINSQGLGCNRLYVRNTFESEEGLEKNIYISSLIDPNFISSNPSYINPIITDCKDGDSDFIFLTEPAICIYTKSDVKNYSTGETTHSIHRGFLLNTDGSLYMLDGKVQVSPEGKFTATDADIIGTINATSISASESFSLYNGTSSSKVLYYEDGLIRLGLMGSDTSVVSGAGFEFLSQSITVYGNMNFYSGNIETPGSITANSGSFSSSLSTGSITSKGAIYIPNDKSLYGKSTSGTNLALIHVSDSNNTIIGYGGYINSLGSTRIYGQDINLIISNASNNPDGDSFRPYFRKSDTVSGVWHGAGYITSSGAAIRFSIQLSKPIVGDPTVTISSVDGLIIRQNTKYLYGSSSTDYVKPSSYSASLSFSGNCINITATMSNTTNVENNSACGIIASIKITFS